VEHPLTDTGINCSKKLKATGLIMLITAFGYIIIQGAALGANCWNNDQDADCRMRDEHGKLIGRGAQEKTWAWIGLVYCIAAFIGYLVYMIKQPEDDDMMVKIIRRRLKASNKVPFALAFDWILSKYDGTSNIQGVVVGSDHQGQPVLVRSASKIDDADKKLAKQVLKPLFNKYDTDKSETFQVSEIRAFMKNEFGKELSKQQAKAIYKNWDKDHDDQVTLDEFMEGLFAYYIDHKDEMQRPKDSVLARSQILTELEEYNNRDSLAAEQAAQQGLYQSCDDNSMTADETHEEEEDEEEFEPWCGKNSKDLTEQEKKTRILEQSCVMMGAGTMIVLLFSDPMVNVLNEIGLRTGIPPFFVAFILAPLASNASELVASYNYAAKKTTATIEVSLQQLLGAANMNNTFCLATFLALICFRPLVWEFTAETISILLIEIVMFFYTFKTTHRLLDGIIVGCLFPFSIFLVWLLEYPIGLN